MRITDFDLYKELLAQKSGLVITPDKSYLLDSRLTPVAKKWGYASLEAMTMALRGVPDRKLVQDVVEAMTTNETSFFRDTKPFDIFKDVVMKHMLDARQGQKSLKIWCAACSSGQEPYSLAMLLKEMGAQLNGWRIDILATDLSEDILDQAKRGIYSQFEVQRGMPIQMLVKYFKQDSERWLLNDDIKRMVRFQPLNLLEPMTSLGRFDIVFCRNVLIYFNEDNKRKVLKGISERLESDGFLFMGGAETVLGITDAFKPMQGQRGLYITKGGKHDVLGAAE